mgnify:CR=1 FL=1
MVTKSALRATDEICRYGGEEFLVVMPQVGEADAKRRAEEIRGSFVGVRNQLSEVESGFAALLSAVMLMFCIAQIGPGLILFPAVAWVYWSGETGWGTFLLLWSLVAWIRNRGTRNTLRQP